MGRNRLTGVKEVSIYKHYILANVHILYQTVNAMRNVKLNIFIDLHELSFNSRLMYCDLPLSPQEYHIQDSLLYICS